MKPTNGDLAIWWIRRDLRLSDNQALSAALEHHNRVIPVFVLDPTLLDSSYSGSRRLAFLLEGLRRLEGQINELGGRLIRRQGQPLQVLAELVIESGAKTIFAESDFSPYARRRDAVVAAQLPLKLVGGPSAHHPEMVRKKDGQPYTVYTPFAKAWKALPRPALPRPAPKKLLTPVELDGDPNPSAPSLQHNPAFLSGEAEGQRLLKEFVSGYDAPIYDYKERRNLPGVEGTSRLSPYLRFGMISARQAIAAAYQAIMDAPTPSARTSAETWLDELIWREFYIAILYHFPDVRKESFRRGLRDINWVNKQTDFQAWQEGRTGYPIVDAAQRELVASGWMHNRARMITASFLVKDLLIDWRWGERFFMQHLLDGDPASNNGGWQWSAGTGTDAAPFFRVFNPVLQGKKFDPNGAYVRRWLPELAQVPEKYLHSPWEMPRDIQRASNCIIGADYPAPIVNHTHARERALAAFKQAKETSEG